MKLTPLPLMVRATTALGFPGSKGTRAERVEEGSWVVPVHLTHRVAEGAQLVAQWLEGAHRLGLATDLQPVAIDDHHQVVQPMVRCGERGFPVRPFGQLSIAHENEGPIRAPGELCGDRRSYSERQPVTERTRVLLDAAHVSRGMADVVRLVATDGGEVRHREEAAVGQHDVECLHRVTLAHHEAVAVRIIDGLRRDLEDRVVEHREDVEARQVAPCVASACRHDGLQDALAVTHRLQSERSCERRPRRLCPPIHLRHVRHRADSSPSRGTARTPRPPPTRRSRR